MRDQLIPDTLLCNYQKNPINIGTGSPTFSWRIKGLFPNEKVIAYQILVSLDPKLLNHDQGDIWNTERRKFIPGLVIPYQGPPLKSACRYYWKVRIWTNQNRVSLWSTPEWFETALLTPQDWDDTTWITHGPGRNGSAIFYHYSFELLQPISWARAYFAAIGYGILWINGKKTYDWVLHPAPTEYSKRVLYSTLDITQFLKEGLNQIKVLTGDGWYGKQEFCLKLIIRNIQGETIIKGTLKESPLCRDWYATPSPILNHSIYDGECYDARYENSQEESSIRLPVYPSYGPGGILISQEVEPIAVTETLTPHHIAEPIPGIFVVDMGINIAGWVKIKVQGKRGQSITLRFAELCHEDGTVNQANLRSAQNMDTYILKGEGEEEWEPSFTYHGFRYVQVEGWPSPLHKKNIQGRIVHTQVPSRGSFLCGHEFINRLHEVIRRTELNNLHGIPTDCPQRDERMGWLNDMTVRAEEAIYNFHMIRLYKKWIDDIDDTQDEKGRIHDTAPRGLGLTPADPVVVSYLLIPWLLYQHYGDTSVLHTHYENFRRWVNFLHSQTQNGILTYSYYGDWAPPLEEGIPNSIGNGAIHKNTPGSLVSTACLIIYDRLMIRIARALQKEEDIHLYSEHLRKTIDAFNQHFWDPTKQTYGSGNQSCLSLALACGAVPQHYRNFIIQQLVHSVINNGYRLTTGNICTKLVLDLLAEYNFHEVALRVILQQEYPGWGYMLRHGATTLWERWEHMTGRGMNSHNHPMLGSVDSWFYKYLGGIQTFSHTKGFDCIKISPYLNSLVSWVETSLECLQGPLHCSWKQHENSFEIQLRIPPEIRVTLFLPMLSVSTQLIDLNGYTNQKILPSIHDPSLKNFKLSLTHGDYSFLWATSSPPSSLFLEEKDRLSKSTSLLTPISNHDF